MTFWKTATKDQRLAQIDGGIECGMTALQIATIVGAKPDQLRSYAKYHGRRIRSDYAAAKRNGHDGGIIGAIISARKANIKEPMMNGAFSIFESPSDPGLFDRHPND